MKVGLVGYGKMGRGIFSLLSDAPLEVAVLVRDPAKADRNNRRLERRLRRAANSGILDEADLPDRLAGLRFTSSWKDLRDCGLVIEHAQRRSGKVPGAFFRRCPTSRYGFALHLYFRCAKS